MHDATFKGYAGSGYTKADGGGLLKPGDFRGMAACLLSKDDKWYKPVDSRSNRRRHRALKVYLIEATL